MTPNNPAPGDELVERLRDQAWRESDAHRILCEAKSARQTDNDDLGGPSVYQWIKPEETVSWKAADEIERLRARDEAARSSTTEVGDLANRCDEVLTWRKTGIYEGNALAEMAQQSPFGDCGSEPSPMRWAEMQTITEALEYVAALQSKDHSHDQ